MRAAIARPYSKPTSSASVLASSTRQAFERRAEQRAEQVVALGREGEVRVARGGAVALRRPARRDCVPRRARRRGSRRPASFSRWWRATLGWSSKCSATSAALTPSRRRAHEEVDVAPGRVAEGAGDRGDRGAELVRGEVFGGHAGYSTYAGSGNPPGGRMPMPDRGPRCSTPCARSRTPRSTARSSSWTWCRASRSTAATVKVTVALHRRRAARSGPRSPAGSPTRWRRSPGVDTSTSTSAS